MPDNSKLLIDEYPLQVLPTLACKIGLNQAIILQQLHFWLTTAKRKKDLSHFIDDRWWVFNTAEEWQEDNFPFWSLSTIRRAITDLETSGLIITKQIRAGAWDHTKWYSIDYDKLNEQIDVVNMNRSNEPKRADRSTQDEQILIESETLTENQSEIGATPQPQPPEPEPITIPGFLGIVHQGEPVKNPRAARALAQGIERQLAGEPDLGWIKDEGLRAMAAVFVEQTKTPFTPKDHSYWVKALTDWRELGVSREDIIGAVAAMRQDRLTISSPNSLTNMIKSKIAQRAQNEEVQPIRMMPGESTSDYSNRVMREFNQRFMPQTE